MATVPPSAAKEGAVVKGITLWLVIATAAIIGIVLAFRHGSAVTSLIGSTT